MTRSKNRFYAAEYPLGWYAKTNEGPRGQQRDDCQPMAFTTKEARNAWVNQDEKRVTVLIQGKASMPTGWGQHVFCEAAKQNGGVV